MAPAEDIESQAMIEAVDSLAVHCGNTKNFGETLVSTKFVLESLFAPDRLFVGF